MKSLFVASPKSLKDRNLRIWFQKNLAVKTRLWAIVVRKFLKVVALTHEPSLAKSSCGKVGFTELRRRRPYHISRVPLSWTGSKISPTTYHLQLTTYIRLWAPAHAKCSVYSVVKKQFGRPLGRPCPKRVRVQGAGCFFRDFANECDFLGWTR